MDPSAPSAPTYRPGHHVLSITHAPITEGANEVAQACPGQFLMVTEVSGDRLRVNHDPPGWIDHRHVIPLNDAPVVRLTAMLQANPTAELHAARAAVCHALGALEVTHADLNEAIRLDPTRAQYFGHRGVTWRAMGNVDRAIADYTEALRLDPNNAAHYTNRGNAWDAKGEVDRAMADFNDAIRVDPQCATAYNSRGGAWQAKGEQDRAIADFDAALRIDPRHANAYYNRAQAWVSKGEHDRAIADLDSAIQLDPADVTNYISRGNAWNGKGDSHRAIADYDAALRLDPNNAMAYQRRGNARFAQGDYKHAVVDYDHALRIQPDYRFSAVFGHLAARCAGDSAAATRLLTAAGNDPGWPYPAIRFLRGEIDEPALLAAARYDDWLIEAHWHIGVVHLAGGRRDDARAHFERVRDHATKDIVVFDLARAELRRLDAADAAR